MKSPAWILSGFHRFLSATISWLISEPAQTSNVAVARPLVLGVTSIPRILMAFRLCAGLLYFPLAGLGGRLPEMMWLMAIFLSGSPLNGLVL